MQQIRFLKEGIKPYMLVPCDESIIDNYQSEVLQQIKIPYFLMYEIREYNGKRIIYYVLKYRTTMKSILEHFPLTPEITRNILICIISAIQTIDDHLMYQDRIVWEMDRIFMDIETGHLEFCYNPMEKQDNGQPEKLVEEMIALAGNQNPEVSRMLSDFYEFLTGSEVTLDDLKRYRKDVFGQDRIPQELYTVRMGQPLIAMENLKKSKNPQEEALSEPYDMQRRDNVTKSKIVKIIILLIAYVNGFIMLLFLFGVLLDKDAWVLLTSLGVLAAAGIYYWLMDKTESVDEIMEEYLETVPEYKETKLLAQCIPADDLPEGFYFVPSRKEEGPPIHINKEKGILGSLDTCDYVYKLEGVSRMHLQVTIRDGSLFIEDMNSTNGTVFRGKMLESGKEYEVHPGQAIGVAGHGLMIDKL